ncbi:unnamed protein product, partial [Prorocentrum cordatum]
LCGRTMAMLGRSVPSQDVDNREMSSRMTPPLPELSAGNKLVLSLVPPLLAGRVFKTCSGSARRPRGLPRAPRRLSGFRGCAEAAVRRLRGGPRADGVRAQGHRRGRGGGAPQLVRVRGPPGGRVLGGGEAAHRGGAGGRVSSRPLGAGGGTAEGPEAAEGRQANGAARCRGGRGSPAAAAAGSRRPATRTPRSWAPCSPPLDCPPAPR